MYANTKLCFSIGGFTINLAIISSYKLEQRQKFRNADQKSSLDHLHD